MKKCEMVPNLGFVNGGNNAYLTENHTVKQEISVVRNNFGSERLSVSTCVRKMKHERGTLDGKVNKKIYVKEVI